MCNAKFFSKVGQLILLLFMLYLFSIKITLNNFTTLLVGWLF